MLLPVVLAGGELLPATRAGVPVMDRGDSDTSTPPGFTGESIFPREGGGDGTFPFLYFLVGVWSTCDVDLVMVL